MLAFSSWSITELVAVNCAVLLPAGTITVGGTVSCELLDESCALTPLGDAAGSVSAQLIDPPPVSVDGLQLIPLDGLFVPCGSSVRICDPAPVAVTVTAVLALTAVAWAVNVVDVAPAPIVADRGTERLALLELRDKVSLVGAGAARLMVHVLLPGVWMVAGAQVKLAALACSVMVVVLLLAPEVAVSVGL